MNDSIAPEQERRIQLRRAQDTTDNESLTHWTFKKEIQLGHVFTTLTVAFSCFMYVNKIEGRLSLVEQQTSTMQLAQRDRDDRQDKNTAELIGLLRQQLDRLEIKIDRISEKRP
jgi:hypothetical protein